MLNEDLRIVVFEDGVIYLDAVTVQCKVAVHVDDAPTVTRNDTEPLVVTVLCRALTTRLSTMK